MKQMTRSGRPKAMQSRPVFMEAVFDDPGRAMAMIRDAAPFQQIGAHYGAQGPSQFDGEGFFRHAMEDETFLHNPNWIAAARQSFGATIVRPVKCLLNLNTPMDEQGAHIDLPSFRGFVPSHDNKSLLMAMIHSGLFYDWIIPYASGLAWFYRGEGGAFLYWDEGVEAPPRIVHPPFWNKGVMSDNEAMFHAVSAVGSAAERKRYCGHVARDDLLCAVGGDGWEVRNAARVLGRLDATGLRMSLLWKAHVFRDEAHLASFEDTALDLTPELIAEVFLEDFASRGIAVEEPTDPLAPNWQAFVEEAYPPPFRPSIAGYFG